MQLKRFNDTDTALTGTSTAISEHGVLLQQLGIRRRSTKMAKVFPQKQRETACHNNQQSLPGKSE